MFRPGDPAGDHSRVSGRPGRHARKAANSKTALKRVEAFALLRDLIPYPFMTGTQTVQQRRRT